MARVLNDCSEDHQIRCGSNSQPARATTLRRCLTSAKMLTLKAWTSSRPMNTFGHAMKLFYVSAIILLPAGGSTGGFKREALMRKVTPRNELFLIGMSALVLMATNPPVLAKEATTAVTAQLSEAWRGTCLAKTVKHRRARTVCHPRPATKEETEQLFKCLFSQPFVTCG